jgi:hypothetical protein
MGRPGLGRAFLVMAFAGIAALGLLGCQSLPSGTPGQSSGAAASPAGPSVVPTPGPSASDILAAALAPLDAASEFESTVTLDGAVATSLAGRTVGSASALTVTTQGRAVEYVRVPPHAWAREPGGAWLVVDSDQTPSSPLAALSAPLSLVQAPSDGALTLEATYEAEALGLEGDPVKVTITIEGPVITFRYEQTSSGRSVVSTTVLRPATDTTPIASPAP